MGKKELFEGEKGYAKYRAGGSHVISVKRLARREGEGVWGVGEREWGENTPFKGESC